MTVFKPLVMPQVQIMPLIEDDDFYQNFLLTSVTFKNHTLH